MFNRKTVYTLSNPVNIITALNKQSNLLKDADRIIQGVDLLRNFAILVLFVNSVFNYIGNLPYSFMITGGFCLFLISSIFWISAKRHELLRTIIVVVLNIVIATLSFAEGIAVGDYLYIFIYIIAAIFIYDFQKPRPLIAALFTCIICLSLIFVFAPWHSNIQRINADMERAMFNFNVFICTITAAILTYLLIKRNFDYSKDLRHKQQFLDTVYNTSLDAVFIVENTSGTISDCNENSIKIFRAGGKQNLINQDVSSLFATEQEEGQSVSLLQQNQSWQGELTCVTVDGFYFPGYISMATFFYQDSLYKKISILDITDIKRTQLALKEAKVKAEEAASAKSKFLSNMSHELRTPLNGIIGTSNLLLHETSPIEQRKNFELLRYSSEHMLILVNDILDFSKIEANKLELEKKPFNLRDAIDHLGAIFAPQFHERNIQFEATYDDKINRQFIGDETRLNQVLTNLVGNAMKFTQKGKVSLEVKTLRSTSEVATIYFAVTDTGVGIPADKTDIIFESFTQADSSTNRKFGGTGLGLAISKKMVEAYNGTLEVKSQYGKGSCFFFTIDLPISTKPVSFINENKMKDLQSLKGLKVLIAEDNPVNMMVARKFLQRWDIDIHEANNGAQALERFGKDSFDLLLIDLEMPEMDGYTFLQHVRKDNHEIPAIAFTAAVYDNMQADLKKRGFTDYIQKPFRPDDLHKKLSSYNKSIQ
jgi:signal transduction histidine kinase/CheY-like chemotaxis protein